MTKEQLKAMAECEPERYALFIQKCRNAAVKQNENRHLTEAQFAAKVREASNGRLEYIRGFVSTDGHFIARCTKCGQEKEYACSSIRTEWFKNSTECVSCRSMQKKTRQAMKVASKAFEDERISGKQIAFSVCKQCGALFIPDGHRTKFCSSECRVKYHNSRREHYAKRREWITERTKDNDITLEKLYERDGGRCYICGRECEWDDAKVINGVFIAGDRYPSVEHVVPLSKGGEHSWENVRLACRRCNYLKRDTPPV